MLMRRISNCQKKINQVYLPKLETFKLRNSLIKTPTITKIKLLIMLFRVRRMISHNKTSQTESSFNIRRIQTMLLFRILKMKKVDKNKIKIKLLRMHFHHQLIITMRKNNPLFYSSKWGLSKKMKSQSVILKEGYQVFQMKIQLTLEPMTIVDRKINQIINNKKIQ